MPDDLNPPSIFDVPEPPVGMGSGFLTEFWKSEEPLPKIKGMEIWLYYLQQGVRTVLALPMSSLITIFTVAVSLFLFAGFLLVLQNIGNVLREAGTSLYLTAYVKEGAPENDVYNFVKELQNNEQIRSVKYISKAEALKQFKADLGSRGGFLEGLEQNNPLPASVDIILRPAGGFSDTEKMVAKLRQVPVIDEVVYGSEWVERAQSIIKLFRLFGLACLLVTLAVIIFLISNTIKLVIYARRDEIAIMQLVGASDPYVKVPFIIGGALQGIIGSFIGLLLLRLAFLLLNFELRNSIVVGIALPEIAFLNFLAIVGVVLIGLVVGAVGSFFALGRFMNV